MYAFHQKHRDLRVPLPFSQRRVTAEAKACRRRSRPRSRWRWWWRDQGARPDRLPLLSAPIRRDPRRRARRAPPGAVFRPLFATSAARGLGVSRAEWAKRSLQAAPAASSLSVGRVESPEARRSRSGDVEGVEARRRTARDQGWYPSA